MSLLIHITIILAVTLIVVPLIKRCHLPSLMGYVLTGVVLGPSVLSIIPTSLELQKLQHLGLLLLLFFIGFELTPQRIQRIQISQLRFSILSLCSISLIFMGIGFFVLQLNFISSILIALALACSSFYLLQQQIKNLLPYSAQQEIFSLNLIFSLFAMTILALLPFLQVQLSPQQHLAYVASLIAAITGLFLFSRYVLVRLFQWINYTKSNELILIAVALYGCCAFVIFNTLGIQSVLAAFLTGLLLADSTYRPQLQSYVKPLKGLGFALFFIAIGLFLPLNLALEQPLLIAFGTFVVLGIKLIINFILAYTFKYDWRNSRLISGAFSSSGEFGLVLLFLSLTFQLSDITTLAPFFLILICTFLLQPFLFIGLKLYGAPHSSTTANTQYNTSEQPALVIIGFGRFGQVIARIAHFNQLRFQAIDNHYSTTDFMQHYGGELLHLDANDVIGLRNTALPTAKLVVVAIDDVEDNLKLIRHLQLYYPAIKLLVRARDRYHAQQLADLNIQHIWRETYLSALALAEYSLHECGVDTETAAQSIALFREHDHMLQYQQQYNADDETELYQSSDLALSELAYLFAADAKAKAEYLHRNTTATIEDAPSHPYTDEAT